MTVSGNAPAEFYYSSENEANVFYDNEEEEAIAFIMSKSADRRNCQLLFLHSRSAQGHMSHHTLLYPSLQLCNYYRSTLFLRSSANTLRELLTNAVWELELFIYSSENMDEEQEAGGHGTNSSCRNTDRLRTKPNVIGLNGTATTEHRKCPVVHQVKAVPIALSTSQLGWIESLVLMQRQAQLMLVLHRLSHQKKMTDLGSWIPPIKSVSFSSGYDRDFPSMKGS